MERRFDKVIQEFEKFYRDFDQKPVRVLMLGGPIVISSSSKASDNFEELMNPLDDRALFLAMEMDIPYHIEEAMKRDESLKAANGYISRRESFLRPVRDPTVTEIIEGTAIPLVKHYYLHVQALNYVLIEEKKTFRDEEISDMDSEF